MSSLQKLTDVMHRLRQECPWDQEQTLDSLQRYLVEETYECIEASSRRSVTGIDPLIEELGDVLLQVVFQAEIISEETKLNAFDLIVNGITEKLIRRHPHIFGDVSVKDSAEVIRNWNKIKETEKGPGTSASLLGSLPTHQTSARLAFEIGKKAERVDFDWDSGEEIFQKVHEEIKELEEAKSVAEKEEELGDLLFCLCQWARKENLEPELALMKANQKFITRFKMMEEILIKRGEKWEATTRPQKEVLWNEAKKKT
jgi:tetrapyrrole methylase family protein/MazG family protein